MYSGSYLGFKKLVNTYARIAPEMLCQAEKIAPEILCQAEKIAPGTVAFKGISLSILSSIVLIYLRIKLFWNLGKMTENQL